MKTPPRLLASAIALVCMQVHAEGHCAADERAFFSCTIRGSAKVLSVCGGPDWMQYRFGRPGKLDLEFPPAREGSLQRFTGAFRYHGAMGVSAYWLMFEQAGTEYAVTQLEGGSNLVGVSVSPAGAAHSTDLQCDARKPLVKDLSSAVELVPQGNP